MKDFYMVLETTPEATAMEIKKAYFSMIRKYHPDKHPEAFKEIREAYEALSNPETRREYDSFASLPQMHREYFTYAREALEDGNFELAIDYLEWICKGYSTLSLVQSLLGEAYLKNGNSGKALKIFEDLTEAHPDNASFLRHLAHAYLKRGWHKKAVTAYWNAIELDEDNLSLWMGLVSAYSKAEDYQSAKAALLDAIQRGKSKHWAMVVLYFRLIEMDIYLRDDADLDRHLDEVAQLAEAQEDIRDSAGWALKELARMLVMEDREDLAYSVIQRVARILPKEASIHDLTKQLEQTLRLNEDMKAFASDDQITEELKQLLSIYLDSALKFEDTEAYDVLCFIHEHMLLRDIHDHFYGLKQFKKKYPRLYAVKPEFFDALLDRNQRRHLSSRYEREAYKHLGKAHAFFRALQGGEDMDDMDISEDVPEAVLWEDEKGQPYVREQPKIGRNDPCPCGSGKKYKKCCGA